ncbi:MAG: PAS domain-containing protein, partial [Gemmatimonadales bacterium]
SLELLCIMDLGGRFTRVNPAFGQVLGYADAELVGRSFFDFVHPDDWHSTRGILDRLGRGETVADIEHRYRANDGSYRVLNWNAVPASDGMRVYATARDKTESYSRQTQLRESEARLRFAADATQFGLWDLDLVNGTAWRSEQHDRIFGYATPQPTWTFERFLQHVVPEDRPAVAGKFREAGERGTDWDFECRITRADGQVRWIWGRGTHVRDATGTTTHMVGGVRDITERKLAETHLRQFERMETVGRLAGGVAHEANNMMSVVLGCAEFILRRQDIPAVVRADATQVREAAQRTAAICAQLLAFSRRQHTKYETLDLNALVTDLQPILRRALGDRIALVWRPEHPLAPVSADRGQLEQVLLNLVLNGRDAMADGGTLSIETANAAPGDADEPARPDAALQPGAYVTLRVRDTGSGMSADTRAHCFEPFYTTKEAGKGTGLGLSTVHGIVHQHGGIIRIASEPGQGTTFTIALPATTALVGDVVALPPATAAGRTATILVVENETSVRQTASRALVDAGYVVLEAIDAEAALALVREGRTPVDLVLSNVVMPGLGGLAVAELLTAERPDVKVILMSGDTGADVARAAARTGFLQKPFSPDTLVGAVNEMLDRPQTRM